MNARKHRKSEPSHTRLFKAGANRASSGSGPSNVARREPKTVGVQSGPKSIPSRMQNMEKPMSWATQRWPPQPQGGESGAALGRPKKLKPECNAPDMPTSVRSNMAREFVEPPQLGKANDERRLSLSASRSCCNGAQPQRPHTSIAKLPDGATLHRCGASISIGRRVSPDGTGLRRLEPCEGKLSRTVLRGAWAG